VKAETTVIAVLILIAAAALAPRPASALCAVEGKLELVRLNLDEVLAFVLQVRPPRGVVPNAFHVERTPSGGLGDIPVLIQMLNLVNPGNTTVLAVGDLASCPDAAEIERARAENKAVFSGRLLRVFIKYR
jgi:hypothetical protein